MKALLFALVLLTAASGPAQRPASGGAPKPSPEIQRLVDEARKLPTKDQLAAFEAALAAAQKAGDRLGEGLVLNSIGFCYARRGQYPRALDYFERALPIRREVGDRNGEAGSLTGLGVAHASLGQYPIALENYSRALAIEREISDRRGEGGTMSNIGIVYEETGQYSKALHYYSRALPILREVGARDFEANTLTNIGIVYNQLGQYTRALESFERALPIMREVGDRYYEARTLKSIGGVYGALDQYSKTLDYYSRALAIQHGIGDQNGEAGTVASIGDVRQDLGQYAIALGYYARAQPIEHEIGDREGEAETLRSMGLVYNQLGQYPKALDLISRALAIQHEIGDRRGIARTLMAMGNLYLRLGQYPKALGYHSRALVIQHEIGDRGDEGGTLCNIGRTYADLGQYPKAMDNYSRALPLLREVSARHFEANALEGIAETYRSFGMKRVAIAFGKQGINVAQSLRAEVKALDRQTQRTYRDSVADRYRRLADWLAEDGRVAEAQQVLGLLKDEEFFEFVRRRAGATAESVDLTPREAEWIRQYEALGEKLAAHAAERDELLKIKDGFRTPEQMARLSQIRAEEELAGKAFASFLSRAEAMFAAKGASGDRVGDIRAGLRLQGTLRRLPNHPAALYTLTTGDGVRVIVDIPGLSVPRQAKAMIPAAQLNKRVLAFREALADPRLDPRSLGAELYDLLVRPVEKDLRGAGVHTLMWSLDGTLRYIPLWALYDRETKQFLIEKYPSCLFTPNTVDGLLSSPRAWSGAEFGVTKGGGAGFAPLPGVGRELAAVHRALGGPPPKLDDAFTVDSFQSALDSQPAVVHIATHFRFRPGDDAGSVLLLGKGQTLSVKELDEKPGTYFSGVDLLVLSACETAMGSGSDGKEFEGFALLAQLHSAGAVLATLWPVADASTALLMGEFYRLRKAHPEWTKLDALRQTQLEMLRGKLGGGLAPNSTRSGIGNVSTAKSGAPRWPSGLPRYSHPYYWAPFVLTGNWK